MPLVTKAKQGDDEAFYQLVSAQRDKLYRIAYAHLRNEQDALDAIQETICRAYAKLHKLREPQYFNTWLVRIAMNYCRDELKHREKLQYGEPPEQRSEEHGFNPTQFSIDMALQELEPQHRQVILLKFFKDMTIPEIAASLDRPDGTIKSWLYRSLRSLRKKLSPRREDL